MAPMEKNNFKRWQCIFTILNMCTLIKRCSPLFEQTLIPFNQRYFMPVLLILAQWFQRKLQKLLMYFYYYAIISPWINVWPFIWKKNQLLFLIGALWFKWFQLFWRWKCEKSTLTYKTIKTTNKIWFWACGSGELKKFWSVTWLQVLLLLTY